MSERMPCHITDLPDEEDECLSWSGEPDDWERDMMPHHEFTAAMDAVKLSQHDMAMLTGKHRRTVWRWRTGRTAVPAYAWTIVNDRKKIRELTIEICK